MIEEWECWRLIVEGIATWEDLNEYWAMEDVLKALAAIDIKNEIKALMIPKLDGKES